MRYKLLTSISFCLFFDVFTSNGLGISSKLDFGESSPKLIGTVSQYRSTSSHYKREEPNGDFDQIGVVCTSGGCNTTKTTNESKDSIQTDVVVHVKTSVDLNKNQTGSKIADDTPDVPVVVGVAGTEYDQRDRFNQRPLVVTNIEDNYPALSPNYPRPLTSTLAPPLSSSYIPPLSSTFAPPISSTYYTPPLSSTFTPANPYPSLYSRSSASLGNVRNVYFQKPTGQAEPRVDINIKSLPPVTLTMSDDGRFVKDIRYKTNGIEIHYPYFEPSYNNHYFGEHTPPQFVFYPKKTSDAVNPVEFKDIPKATWMPSFWSFGTPIESNHRHTSGAHERCQCKNEATVGLQWHPLTKTHVSGDPGTQINDKLAPLN